MSIFGKRHGIIYHRRTCKYYSPGWLTFNTRADAHLDEHKPCRTCRAHIQNYAASSPNHTLEELKTAIFKIGVLFLAEKIIASTEMELNDGKHEGNEKRVAEILNAARKLTTDKDELP